jgi:glucose/arabinose dehydrogenase
LKEIVMRLVLAVSAFLIVSHAAGATDAVFPSSAGNLKVQTVASGLVYPWSLAFLPDGRMLVAERPGRLRIIAADGRLSPPLGNVPKVYAVSQAGLMDILLARDFAQSRTIFVCYAEAAEGGGRIAVLRARLIEDESPRLDDVTVIFRQKGPVSRGLNIGCRMVQAQDDNLFVTLGDHFGPKELAQKLDNHIGKIVRITPDGAAPADNPFIGNRGALPEIWAYGLRNAQGLAFNPADGKLWEQEHGPMGGDEINIIEKAQNYGWPRVSYGVNYDGTPVGSGDHGGRHRPDLALDAFDRTVWNSFLHRRPHSRLERQLVKRSAEV